MVKNREKDREFQNVPRDQVTMPIANLKSQWRTDRLHCFISSLALFLAWKNVRD